MCESYLILNMDSELYIAMSVLILYLGVDQGVGVLVPPPPLFDHTDNGGSSCLLSHS